MFGSWIRRTAFWTLDCLKGGPVKKQYDDIVMKEHGDYCAEDDLKTILQYAKDHVPYYKGITGSQISEFPVMTKSVYKREKLNCFSDEYLDLSLLHKVSTSGSTGEPMVVYQNREKRDRVKADLIHAHEKIGWELGDKYIFIRNWVSNYAQSKVKAFAQNVVPVSISDFDDGHKKRLADFLMRHPQTVLFGYSSSVCDFMQFLNKNGIDGRQLKVKVVVCDSDELTLQNKERLHICFGCPIINRYDNEENGLIAISSEDSDIMKVNYEGLYIELLEDCSERHVAPGTMGRVVITDLHNKAMPLIRYDTGDYAVSEDPIGHIHTLKEISGRQASSLIALNGNIVSSVAISGITEIFSDIEKYQVTQTSRDAYRFEYVGHLSDIEFTELMNRLRVCLGSEAQIDIIPVSEIPKGKNGKFRTIVNLTI